MEFVFTAFYYLMQAYFGLIVLNIILSWIPFVYNVGFFRFLRRISDAYIGVFRGYLTIGFLDFTPVVGIILYEGIMYLYTFLINSILSC